ncbi:DNA-3-methyladenine glycosylase 2 family protein [Anaerobacillus alkaliphilus]|uniref:DNA-3-methyladenine glycosylase II n=1 Tax=Anaerobacillus alkaliphilus TaxID=1548597 RepID=A0A4V1LGD1_9BACI|nr:DNA-3-methyladenine glycosylase [Anaerobacillus alkaliphilus]RXJ00342.1 DNA-3-methyladenine glycosylase 2 family protein [Anaerobacillus alkaliphilus]
MMEIQVSGPYNYPRVLERLSYDPLNVIHDNTIRIPLQLFDDLIVVNVSFSGEIASPTCYVELPKDYEEEGIRKVKEVLQLEVPLQQVHNHFLHTDLEPIFNQFSGLPLVCDFDLYFCMMKTIIHQQLNIRFAYTLTERFVKTFGTEKDGVWFYPSAKTVSELKYEDLRELQFSQRKAEYVIDTSRLIVNGELDLAEIRMLQDQEAIDKLVKIRGVGYWTAENILLFGLARKDLFPVKDIGIQNAIKKFYNFEQKPTLEEMLKLSEGWAPYRSYASLYLWESLDNQKARS